MRVRLIPAVAVSAGLVAAACSSQNADPLQASADPQAVSAVAPSDAPEQAEGLSPLAVSVPEDSAGTESSAAATDAAATDPAGSDPATTAGSTTQAPATTQAPTTDPATTEPQTSEPTTTEPATTEAPTTAPPTTVATTSSAPPTTEPSSGTETRQIVLDLALPTYGGGEFDPGTVAGRPIILWFWGAF